jgi:ubiquinone/menaquinone biosynthesis C-methylase UbiE
MLKTAKEKVEKAGLQGRVEVKQCDLRKLDFADETFDLVFCEHALCFVKEQETVVRELVRVLKKGCPLLVSGQNRYVLSFLAAKEDVNVASKVLLNQKQFIMRNSLNVYALSPKEFRQLLEANGVCVQKVLGKLFTVPLVLSAKQMSSEKYSKELYQKLLEMELELSSKQDAVALGGHFQATGYKR